MATKKDRKVSFRLLDEIMDETCSDLIDETVVEQTNKTNDSYTDQIDQNSINREDNTYVLPTESNITLAQKNNKIICYFCLLEYFGSLDEHHKVCTVYQVWLKDTSETEKLCYYVLLFFLLFTLACIYPWFGVPIFLAFCYLCFL